MDPYEVLGLSRGATDEEIKAAYRELVKKYHPDKYINNPLADLAEEKLREINEAYDMLMKPTTTTTSSYHGSSYGGSSYSGSSSTYGTGQYYENATYGAGYDTHYSESGSRDYYEIRSAIDSNQFGRAQQLLAAKQNRTAEWYFLSGVLNYKIGYFDTAMQQVKRAMSMAPQNAEYQDAYRKMSGTGAIYKTTSYNRGYSSPSCVDCAMCYCLGNTFCC